MANISEWYVSFKDALDKRRKWLFEKRIIELKAQFGDFRTTYSRLYAMLLKRNLIVPDPYKKENPANDLDLPETGPILQPGKRETFSGRFAKYDNLLEYIAFSHVFSIETLKPDKIDIIQAIIRFIDWNNFSPTSTSPNTQVMAEMIAKMRKFNAPKMVVMNFDACCDSLAKISSNIELMLEDFRDYYGEAYKGGIRALITAKTDGIATFDNIKEKFPRVFPDQFFNEKLVQELINEDYSPLAQIARQHILKKLAVPENQPSVKKHKSLKLQLVEGLQALGSTANTFHKLIGKIEHNHEIYRKQKKSFVFSFRGIIEIIFRKKRNDDFFEYEIANSAREPIDHYLLIEELSAKVKVLRALAAGKEATLKLEAMSEKPLFKRLDECIYEVQRYYRLLTALDRFFKAKITDRDKHRLKGMRPELSTIRSALTKAILKKENYLASRELEELQP
jgi:hypothetical protein